MKVILTEWDSWILSLSDTKNTLKLYEHSFGSHMIQLHDRDVLTFHKKTYKSMAYKELGQKFVIFDVNSERVERELDQKLSHVWFELALSTFTSFDENSGMVRPFFYQIGLQKATQLIENLALLHSKKVLEKEYMLTEIDWQFYWPELKHKADDILVTIHDKLSYLFAMNLLYGKMQVNSENAELVSIKIQVPYFGQFTWHIDTIKKIKSDLFMYDSLFVDMYDNNNWVLEIVINDYEILEQFAEWYKPIESLTKIPKKDAAYRHKEAIIAFLKDGWANEKDVQLIENAIVKPLVVG